MKLISKIKEWARKRRECIESCRKIKQVAKELLLLFDEAETQYTYAILAATLAGEEHDEVVEKLSQYEGIMPRIHATTGRALKLIEMHRERYGSVCGSLTLRRQLSIMQKRVESWTDLCDGA